MVGLGGSALRGFELAHRWKNINEAIVKRKRLLQIPNVKPFVVQNLGKSKRQQWQAAEFHPHPPSPAGRRGDEMAEREGEKMFWFPGKIADGLILRARQLRQEATPAEQILWEVLRNRQFEDLKFRRQHIILGYIADFYCAEHKLAIELDGSVHNQLEQQERDKLRDEAIAEEEITVRRFKNDVVFDNLRSILEAIHEHTTASNSPLPAGEGLGVREMMAQREQAYRNFILELYSAEPVKGYVWLHGMKARRMVHVGSVDSPVSSGDVKAIIQEFWKNAGKGKGDRPQTNGVDVLGWEFALDMNETARQAAAANNVDLKFKKIPREVLEKKAVEAGDIKFFELAGLDVRANFTARGGSGEKGKKVELELKDFVIPPDDVPEEARKSITHWSQWIDYWAVDWSYKDDTFHNEWQSYRTKKEPKISLTTEHTYDEKGSYTIVVKVIDILGNDTTKALKVEVK